ncbi:unnamed protein product [Protopolystoma xenopodis]|uniref:Uncharacterized protein n=1 Tax=Protopolystoma xenopodis TaxID=117903 RepID=A0A448XQV6_9PLAT|nr:unnamed protein product [Protopolystoma xenopodis]
MTAGPSSTQPDFLANKNSHAISAAQKPSVVPTVLGGFDLEQAWRQGLRNVGTPLISGHTCSETERKLRLRHPLISDYFCPVSIARDGEQIKPVASGRLKNEHLSAAFQTAGRQAFFAYPNGGQIDTQVSQTLYTSYLNTVYNIYIYMDMDI